MATAGELSSPAVENLDANVLAAIPDVDVIQGIEKLNHKSRWAESFRITLRKTDQSKEDYFMKVSLGYHGREALRGEFTSTSAMHSVSPTFCPRPIAWGTFEGDENTHFYMCKFYNFHNTDHRPDPHSFCKNLAILHVNSESPNGKFGFDCTTYNGNLPQDNTWQESWETFFANGLRHVLDIRKERAGPHPAELGKLLPQLFDVVIPRLLRPLQSDGRNIKPSLVHGDLWGGNASVVVETNEGIAYDPASFYAHHEYELGNWVPSRNNFKQVYFDAYHSLIEKSEPEEDYHDRIALYALYVSPESWIKYIRGGKYLNSYVNSRFNLHAATLFPEQNEFMEMFIDGIKELNDKFSKIRSI